MVFTRAQLLKMSSNSGLVTVGRQRGISQKKLELAKEEMRKYIKQEAEKRKIALLGDNEERLTNFLISFVHKFEEQSE